MRRLGLSLAGVREVLDATHAVTRDVRADASIVGEPLGAALRRCTFGAVFDWARTGAARTVAADVATGATWVAGLLPDDWRPEMLSAAIGTVPSRFDAECMPVLGVIEADDVHEPGDGMHRSVALDRLRMRMLPVAGDEAECTVGALLDTIAARWSAPPVFDTATRAALSIAAGAAGDMAVGLLLDGMRCDGGFDSSCNVEYRPCLAPPFPLTVVPMLTDGGRIALGCRYDPRRFDESMVERRVSDDAYVPPSHGAGHDAAAYVIYTSGSTGRPKGVVVPHRNVMDLIAATRDDFGFRTADVWTLFRSAAFDFSVWEIWGCLTTGGHLVVVPYWTSRSPDDFLQLLARERVTVLNQTPAAFAQLQQADSRAPAELVLRLVIFGGEALDAWTLLPWFDRHPESACRVVNMFGITETTVHVTAETITRRHALGGSRAVSRPIPSWHLYVTDAQRRHMPPGVAGEIYVGGAGASPTVT